MKAIVQRAYGPPSVLGLEDIERPRVGPDEVLVKVYAASANAGDWHIMRGDPYPIRFMFGGLFRPKPIVLGSDIAGRVEAVGRRVSTFEPGDEVFGDVSESGLGAFAEYVRVPSDALMHKPAGVSFEEAAAVPVAALAALQGLRDKGQLKPGDKVLINGASGGVGTFAVQIAKAFGAHVTGVCSTRNLELVRSLGADVVIDYTREDFTKRVDRYDLILDAAACRSPLQLHHVLKPDGRYVLVGGSTARMVEALALGPWLSFTGKKRFRPLMSKPSPDDLICLRDLLESSTIKAVIDRRYDLSEVPAAIAYLEQGHARGKVIINVEPGSAGIGAAAPFPD